MESRLIWNSVAQAINCGDFETANREKSKLENSQRNLRKQEKEQGIEWKRKNFAWIEQDPVVESLV